MAKVSASAPASGQAPKATPDPEPATAPAKTTRATRGQSREPQQNQRRSARNARSASVENETSPSNAVKNVAETDLPTVDEDMAEENGGVDLNASFDAAEDAEGNAPSPSRASAVSGMTAKTTFSVEEMNELDTEVMLDSLRNLDSASEELLKVLTSPISRTDPTTLDQIATEGTTAYKLYQKRLNAFVLYKSDYTAGQQDYIRAQNVSRALFEASSIDDIPQNTIRPDCILFKANLAYMLHILLVHMRNPSIATYDKVEALEGLNQVFPTLIAGPTFDPSAFNISVALTTQLAINQIASFIEDPNFSPQGLAEHAFFSDSENDTPTYRHHNGLHLDDLSDEQRSVCLDRIKGIAAELKQPFDDNSELDAVEALESVRQTWPWALFLEKTVFPYCQERKGELDIELHNAGGIDNLHAAVTSAVQQRDDLKRVAELATSLRQSSGKSKKQSMTASAIQALAVFNQTNGPSTPGMAPQGMAPVANMGYAPSNQFDVSSSQPNLAALSQFQNATRAQKSSAGRGRGRGRGKGKSFNDRQSGAERVEFESQAQGSVLGKRTRDAEDEQPQHWEPTQDVGPHEDDDDAFETRVSDNAAADARRLAAPASVSQARSFLSRPPQFGAEPDSPSMQQRTPKRRNPGSSAPNPADYPGLVQYHSMTQDANADPNQPPPSTSRVEDYYQSAWAARQYRILNHSTPARERRVWTDDENNALLQYIEEWPLEDNLHYAAIKRNDTTEEGLHALNGRTAEDIRFRARNMKVNYLLGRNPDIHPNWNKVQLAKKEIDKLHARGVPYAQIGLRGTPANATGVVGTQE